MDTKQTKSTPRTNLKKRRRVAAHVLFLTFAALAIVIFRWADSCV